MASTMHGLLSLKKKSGVSDSWSSYLCEYVHATNVLSVKSKDGKSSLWERTIEGAWPLEAKANRRAGRFDVLCADGQTEAFAAPSDGDAVRWVEALHGGALLANRSHTIASAQAEAPSSDSFDIAGDEVDSEIAAAAGQAPSLPVEEPTLVQQVWKANFAQFVLRDDVPGPDLQPSEFFELVKEVLSSQAGLAVEGEAAPEPPSDSDLEACFQLADDDKSGKISAEEFVRLMGLIVDGGVKGLSTSGPSSGGRGSDGGLAPEQMKFKSDLRKAEASDARNRALSLTTEASALALEARKAARLAASERRKSNPPELATAGELEWRKKFAQAVNGGEGLDRTKFVLLVKKVLLSEFMRSRPPFSSSGGKTTAGFDMPTDGDLDAAFRLADADESGIVDEREFLQLMVLIRAGKVEGLGSSSFFSFGGSSAVDKEARFKAEIEAAKAAVPRTVIEAETAAKAATDKAKAAIAAAKAAESNAKAKEEAVNNGATAGPPAAGNVQVENEEPVARSATVHNSEPETQKSSSASVTGQGATRSAGSVIAQSDKSAIELLSAQGVDLVRFVLPLRVHGVGTAAELKGCSDAWLATHAGLSARVHLAKLRRVVPDTTDSMPHTASDGFKGSTDAEVKAHEAKLHKLRLAASEDGVNGRGPESEDAERREIKLGMRLLASRGAAPKDATNEASEMLKMEGEQNISARDRKLWHLYEAPDGFRGTYDEVLAYERRLGFVDGNHPEVAHQRSASMVYEASDGFCGTYQEVLAHEEKVRARVESAADDTGKRYRLYKCSDGFRGSYEDCLAHEKFHGLDVQWQNPDEVRNHLHGLHDEMASLQAEAAELRAELAALESK